MSRRKIFVFGSNLAGRHGAGSALAAVREWGAEYGKGVGLQGNAYAIPTKGYAMETLALGNIALFVTPFIAFARKRQDMEFRVVDIGCGLAGYKPEQVAPLFEGAPGNCKFVGKLGDLVKPPVPPIDAFNGAHRFLSNFHGVEVPFEGWRYPSVEHAYQAAKSPDKAYREMIRNAATAGQAKRLAKGMSGNDPTWHVRKLPLMHALLMFKFRHGSRLEALLLHTRPRVLIEGNTWGDRFWGCEFEDGEWRGENHLGKLLMEIRDGSTD